MILYHVIDTVLEGFNSWFLVPSSLRHDVTIDHTSTECSLEW